MPKKLLSATMSFEDIVRALEVAIRTAYPPTEDDYATQPWIVDTFDGFAIVRMKLGSVYGTWRFDFTLDEQDHVHLAGEPREVEEKFVYKGTMELAASKVAVVAGKDAEDLLAEQFKSNGLFAALKDSPNTHFVVLDLTTIGRASQHAGQRKYKLMKAGAQASLLTLISKPIHITSGLDGHFEAGQPPKPIGAFLGAALIDNADGTQTVRAIGTLWETDFPREVEAIKAAKAVLGGSYEIFYPAAAAAAIEAEPGVMAISAWEYSGGAILLKSAAAHQETQLLVADKGDTIDVLDEMKAKLVLAAIEMGNPLLAEDLSTKTRNNLSDDDFALVQTMKGKDGDSRKVRRFPINDEAHRKNAWARINQANVATDLSDSERAAVKDKIMNRAKREGDAWAEPYKKVNGRWMKGMNAERGTSTMEESKKYPGFTVAQEAAIDVLVASAVKQAQAGSVLEKAQAELKAAQDELAAMKKKMDEHDEHEKEMAQKVTALEASLAEKTTALEAETKAKAEAELKAKKDEIWAGLVKEHKFTDDLRASKDSLIEKLAAGLGLSLDEHKTLLAGAKVDPKVPLAAGTGGDTTTQPDEVAIKTNFPAATALRRIR